MKPVFTVVIPVFNEEAVIDVCYNRLAEVMESLGESYELIFVNDGSTDQSGAALYALHQKDQEKVRIIYFSRNFGHQPAITAGMEYARGDAVIVIDADLQDPPEVIPAMIQKWREGYEVVYGKRVSRQGETFFKKCTAKLYYRLLKEITNFEIPVDTGDFRLIDRTVCEAMKLLPERNRYVRGLISWVGFRQAAVEYVREERFAGKTKYPLKKMIQFAMDGVTAFSYKPLKLATTIGLSISMLSFIYLVAVCFQALFTDTTIIGWASLIAVILFTQGIVLMMLGLMGEYIGRIFEEMKQRPIYIVQKVLDVQKED